MRGCIKILILFFFLSGTALGHDSNPHKILDELLAETENLRPGQAISVFDLQKAEQETIAKLKKIANTNPDAFLQRDSEGKTVAMRVAHAGLINTLAEIIKIPVVNRSLRKTRDRRGFSTADQVVTAPFRTKNVCENSTSADHFKSGGLWATYASMHNSYENILSAFVNKIPTNPRTVANSWLNECPNAAQDVRKKMVALSKENSSKKIQTFLLNENKKHAEKLRRLQEDIAIAESAPDLDVSTANALATATTYKVGPIELANNPNGKGVLIARISGERSNFKADTNAGQDVYGSVGHRVTHIEYLQLSSLKDVKNAISEFREKKFKTVSMTLYVGENYGRKVIDISVPID